MTVHQVSTTDRPPGERRPLTMAPLGRRAHGGVDDPGSIATARGLIPWWLNGGGAAGLLVRRLAALPLDARWRV